MKDLAAKRRAALKALIDSFGNRKTNWVAIKSGVAEAALRAFLGGKTGYLEEPTYDKLATWSHWTVAELKGEDPPPSPNDILSRKSGTQPERGNDSFTMIVHDDASGARNGGGDHQEGEMVYQLRLELVDRIWELPAERLEGLRKHIEAIEMAMAQLPRPHQRGKTGL
jgi:hypothetical protein